MEETISFWWNWRNNKEASVELYKHYLKHRPYSLFIHPTLNRSLLKASLNPQAREIKVPIDPSIPNTQIQCPNALAIEQNILIVLKEPMGNFYPQLNFPSTFRCGPFRPK